LPEVVPPAPDDGLPPADVAPPVSTAGVAVPPVAAGLAWRFALAVRFAAGARLAVADGFAAAFRLRGVAARGLGRLVPEAAAGVEDAADGLAFAVR
jgi:hypothetical protein